MSDAARFTDGVSWADFGTVALGDDAGLPPWCLMARTDDLGALALRAHELGWQVGPTSTGGHETRLRLDSPGGLTLIGYSPLAQP
ncbi:hypothetical protein NODU109028_12950 [Nocardioides dubius]|uniref:VOC domain-containing protein n=1 Tax=Nocardioides dubius TaxID=317019 RepID=A0ABN1TVP1_9ACTN